MIRLTNPDIQVAGLGEKTQKALSEKLGEKVDIRQVEMVGPQVGEELREKALYAIFYALLIMAVYISGRFEHKWLMAIIMAGCLIAATSFAAILRGRCDLVDLHRPVRHDCSVLVPDIEICHGSHRLPHV